MPSRPESPQPPVARLQQASRGDAGCAAGVPKPGCAGGLGRLRAIRSRGQARRPAKARAQRRPAMRRRPCPGPSWPGTSASAGRPGPPAPSSATWCRPRWNAARASGPALLEEAAKFDVQETQAGKRPSIYLDRTTGAQLQQDRRLSRPETGEPDRQHQCPGAAVGCGPAQAAGGMARRAGAVGPVEHQVWRKRSPCRPCRWPWTVPATTCRCRSTGNTSRRCAARPTRST